jgi:hypothetical protein
MFETLTTQTSRVKQNGKGQWIMYEGLSLSDVFLSFVLDYTKAMMEGSLEVSTQHLFTVQKLIFHANSVSE